MKLQIDTTLKTIQVEGRVNLLELTEALERMFPNGLWKTFTLETNTTIIWNYPVHIYPYYPYYPWWTTTPLIYTTGSPALSSGDTFQCGDITYSLQSGIYNVEI